MKTPHSIQHTTPQDIETVQGLFDQAIQYQKMHGYPVWDTFETEVLRRNIEDKVQYKILMDDEIALVFNAEYADKVIWREYDKDNAVYLHHIVVSDKYRGQKLMRLVIDWAISHVREKQLSYLRLDTWGSNSALIEYYKTFGFRFVEFFTTPAVPEIPPYYWGLELALLGMPIK